MNLFKRFITPTFYIVLGVFIYFYVQTLDFNKLGLIQINYGLVAVATLLGLAFRYWGAAIWFMILNNLGASGLREKTATLIYIYAKSWLGRYIPGTAPWILGKIYFASEQGISKNKLAVSSLLEGILQIIVLMALSFLLLIFDSRLDVIDPIYKFLVIASLIACGLVLIPKVFNNTVAFIYKKIRKKTFEASHKVTTKLIGTGALWYLGGALINGYSFFLICQSIYPALDYSVLLYVIGVMNLAGALSMLAVFAPGGLGVREGIQLVLLSLIMPAEIALIITVVSRIWSVGVDLLFFAFGFIGQKVRTRS